MTIEEIERTLQTVAENQARFYADIGELNDQTAKLAEAQLANESRQTRLEEAFQQVAQSFQLLVEFARDTDGRLDALEEAQVHTDTRLDALIDSQIQLTHRVDALTQNVNRIAEQSVQTNGRIDTLTNRIERLAELQGENAEQIKELIAAQAAVATKSKATKKARKSTKKGGGGR
jgi:chromosome segregation ATPase